MRRVPRSLDPSCCNGMQCSRILRLTRKIHRRDCSWLWPPGYRASQGVRFITFCPILSRITHFRIDTQPLGKNLSFLEDPRTFEGRGRARWLRRFRKAHLENILPRGSWDRDPRYPEEGPMGPNFFLKNFLSKSYLGICRQVWGLLWVKSDFWPKNGYLWL